MQSNRIKLSGPTGSEPIEIEAKVIVGQLAIHRPVYRYMPHLPVTYGTSGWNVTHVPTGGSLTQHAPEGASAGKVSLKALKAWAEAAQKIDPEAWEVLAALQFGVPKPAPALGRRIIDALRAA